MSLDLRAGLRQLQTIAELRDALGGIEAAIQAEHQELKDYLSEALNPQPPLHIPIIVDDEKARFVFRAQRVPFAGRARELAALRRFLAGEAPFRWWLTTGPAGTGKSRLALELCLRAPQPWRAGFLHGDTDFDSFERWQPFEPTLLVIDYAARDPKRVGKWLRQLAARRKGDRELQAPVRVLLLERAKLDGWWGDLTAEDPHGLRQCLHPDGTSETPLALADDAEDRTDIAWHTVTSLFDQAGRSAPDRATTLAALAEIDPRLPALVAAFAADALLAGRDVRGWDRTRLLEDVIERTRRRLWRPTAERHGADLARHELLLRLATVTQGLPLSVLEAPPAGLRLPARDPEDEHGFCAPLFEAMIAGGTVTPSDTPTLAPLEPDILGEVFVLTAPERLSRDPQAHARQLGTLADAAWRTGEPLKVASFLDRAAADFFPDDALSALLRPRPDRPERAAFWAMVANNIAARGHAPVEVETAVTLLDELRELARRWSEHPEIALQLAKGLYNRGNHLAAVGELGRAGERLDELRELARRWSKNPEIARQLAMGLYNRGHVLAAAGELGRAGKRLDELRELARRWSGHPEIALRLARGLYNRGNDLAAAGELGSAGKRLDELRELARRWSEYPEIALQLAMGLVNRGHDLAAAGELGGAGKPLDELRELARRWSEHPEIALQLAMGLANRGYDLAAAGELGRAGKRLDELRDLVRRWSEHPEIALRLAGGLVNRGDLLAAAGQRDEAGSFAIEAVEHVIATRRLVAPSWMRPSSPGGVISPTVCQVSWFLCMTNALWPGSPPASRRWRRPAGAAARSCRRVSARSCSDGCSCWSRPIARQTLPPFSLHTGPC